MKRLWWVLIALLAASLLLAACGDDDDDDDDNDTADDDVGDDDTDGDDDDAAAPCDFARHDPLIAGGKDHLMASEVHEAYESFDDALDLCPDSMDARMGLALSCQLQLERQLYTTLDWLLSVFPEAKEAGGEKSFGSTLQAVLLNQFHPKALEMLTHAWQIRQAPANWSFYIEEYPFLIEGEDADSVVIDMGGEWDHADAVMIEAEAHLYSGLALFLGSYNLTFDWYWVENPPDLGSSDILDMIHEIATWLLDVVTDENYPAVLLLRGDLGRQYLPEAGNHWGSVFAKANEAADMMLLETDDQTDDVAGYVDENENGRWDEGEPYHLPHIGVMTNDQNLTWLGILYFLEQVGLSIWDTGEMDVDPDNPNPANLGDLNFFIEALGFEPFLPDLEFNLGPFFNDPQDAAFKEFILQTLYFLETMSAPDAGEEA